MLNSMQLYEKIEKIRVQKGIPVGQKSKVWIVYALHWEYPLPNCCMTSIRTN